MSLHLLPVPHARRVRFPFTIFCSLACVAGLVAMVGFASAADPIPPASPSARPATPYLSDVMLARSALMALDAEAELKGVNLVVSVVDGVAVIGGSVPNTTVSKRAEQVVRKVDGIKDVRNSCFVSTGPDPLLKAVADKRPSTLPPRPVMAELPGVLTNQFPQAAPFQPDTSVASAADPNSTVVARRLPTAGGLGVLGAPVGPVGSGIAVAAPPVVPATAPGRLTGTTPAAAADVQFAVGEMRKLESRFAKLTVETRDGTLVIGGSAPLAADAWDFAQKLRTIPGVSRVAIGTVTGK
jgi:BON domain